MPENNENQNQFDLDWQALRNEYQGMMNEDSEEDIYPANNNSLYEEQEEIKNTDMDFLFPTKPYEDDDEDYSTNNVSYTETEDEDEKEKLDEQIYKSKQNLAEFEERNRKFKIDIGSIAKNGFSKMVGFTNNAVSKATKKSARTSEWSEEKQQELSTIIVVGFCVIVFFAVGLLLIKVPGFIGNVFEFIGSRDTIESDGIVYIDEKTRTYHFSGCPHIEEGMRYLTLEETYAHELGYEGCEYIETEK